MEKAAAITALGTNESLIVLTAAGRIYKYVATPPPGVWTELPLPPDFGTSTSELIDAGGRMPQLYKLHKRADGLFLWERAAGDNQPAGESEPFERMEGAIAAARNDYMIRHRPRPAPRPEPQAI